MKKIISLLLIIVLIFTLVSCSGYISSYSALGLVKSSFGNKCETSFFSLNGTLVFNLRAPSEGDEGDIYFSATLTKGTISVYYDIFGVKEPLFTISGGESIEEHRGYIEEGKRVDIIIEAKGAKNGSIKVELDT